MMATVDSADVVRLMMQYCQENGLTNSLSALHAETGVSLVAVGSVGKVTSDIRAGKWDLVLTALAHLQLPADVGFLLYEQVLFELLEAGAVDVAQQLLEVVPLCHLRKEQPSRWLKLEHLCKPGTVLSTASIYEYGQNRTQRREHVAEAISGVLTASEPSRLLTLIGRALSVGGVQEAPTGHYDLMAGRNVAAKAEEKESDEPATSLMATIRVGAEAHAESLCFSPDGSSMALGCVDGVLDIWDPVTCRQRQDLEYLAEGKFLGHDDPVLCCAFSSDGTKLASACQKGELRVWQLSTGLLLRKFPQAHSRGITCVAFSRDGDTLLTGSFDETVRAHGMKSGKMLKEYRGHTSYVNCICYAANGVDFFTGSSDGTVKRWNAKTGECESFYPDPNATSNSLQERAVHSLHVLPKVEYDALFVCPRGATAYVLGPLRGESRKLSFDDSVTGASNDLVCAAVSPRGTIAYCVTDDRKMHIFDLNKGLLLTTVIVSDDPTSVVIGVAHHPSRNVVATFTEDGVIRLWKTDSRK